MNSLEAGAQNPSAVTARESLEHRLRVAGLDTQRFVDLPDGTKASCRDHTDPENQYEASKLTGTYGVIAGDDLLLLDVDSYREGADGVPTWVDALPDTYTVTTPHGGEHRYYAVDGRASNSRESWGEVRAENQYVVGPGSVLDRCTKDWHSCSGAGEGQYTVLADLPIASISADDLPQNAGENTAAGGHDWDGELPEVDAELAGVGETILGDLQHEYTPAFNALVGLLRGDDGGDAGVFEDLVWRETGGGGRRIDRSLQELMALTRLHEAVVYLGNEEGERAEAITRATFEQYVRSHEYTVDGRRRRWLEEGESYKRNRLGRAFADMDRGKFQRFLNLNPVEDERRRWGGKYSATTIDVTRFALDLLTGEHAVDPEEPDVDGLRDTAAATYGLDLDRDVLSTVLDTPHRPVQGTTRGGPGSVPECESPDAYPTKSEVVEAARALDGEHDEEATYDEALKRLRRGGVAALACVEEGVDYRYYPARLPDPPNAEYVRTAGEKRDPEPREEPEGSSGEVRLRADGGEPMIDEDDTTTGDEYSNADLRERFPEVVVSTSPKSSKVLHLPDGDEVNPMCGTVTVKKSWRRKPVEVYPSADYYEYCDRCRQILREDDRVGDAIMEDDW